MRRARLASMAMAALLTLTSMTFAADWPQWRGQARDNKSTEKGLLQQWPEGGPKLLWTFKKGGSSYSSFAVVGDRIYTTGAEDNGDEIFAIDVKTGKEIWRTSIGGRFKNRWGDGPRGTPTIDGERLYAMGGSGDLACLSTENGKSIWSVNLRTDLGGRMMSGWGYSESVLVDGDLVICTPGGNKGTLAALNKATGKVVWRSDDVTDAAAYSSPITATIGTVKAYIQQTKAGLVGVRAKDGKLLFRHTVNGYRTAVIPTPIYQDGRVYVTVGYGVGCYQLALTAEDNGEISAKEVYANNNLESKHGGALLLDGYLYGHHDRSKWVCQDFKTGKVVWSESGKLDRRNRSGSLTYADGRLYLFSDRGTVALIEASPKGWKEHGRFKLPQLSDIRSRSGGVWSHPVVANGRLYLRDQDLIFCYDVSANKDK